MVIKAFEGKSPNIHPDAYLAENATIVGDVTILSGASIWYGAVVRGDFSAIHIGKNTCVEDNAVLHAGVNIQDGCVIGHGAIVQSSTIEQNCLIGMGAILLDGCNVGAGSIVAAGSLVLHSLHIPPGSLVMGNPATVVRPLREHEMAGIVKGSAAYVELAQKQLMRYHGIAP